MWVLKRGGSPLPRFSRGTHPSRARNSLPEKKEPGSRQAAFSSESEAVDGIPLLGLGVEAPDGAPLCGFGRDRWRRWASPELPGRRPCGLQGPWGSTGPEVMKSTRRSVERGGRSEVDGVEGPGLRRGETGHPEGLHREILRPAGGAMIFPARPEATASGLDDGEGTIHVSTRWDGQVELSFLRTAFPGEGNPTNSPLPDHGDLRYVAVPPSDWRPPGGSGPRRRTFTEAGHDLPGQRGLPVLRPPPHSLPADPAGGRRCWSASWAVMTPRTSLALPPPPGWRESFPAHHEIQHLGHGCLRGKNPGISQWGHGNPPPGEALVQAPTSIQTPGGPGPLPRSAGPSGVDGCGPRPLKGTRMSDGRAWTFRCRGEGTAGG